MNKEKLIKEMKNYFGDDEKRIKHALSVLSYAERIIEREGGYSDVIIAAAIFHDIGIPEAERKYRSTAGKYQEIEGPPIARGILKNLGISQKVIDEVCEIIAHHHSPGKIDSKNFKILFDADWLVNLPEMYDLSDRQKTERLIDRLFFTDTGKAIAKKEFLKEF